MIALRLVREGLLPLVLAHTIVRGLHVLHICHLLLIAAVGLFLLGGLLCLLLFELLVLFLKRGAEGGAGRHLIINNR